MLGPPSRRVTAGTTYRVARVRFSGARGRMALLGTGRPRRPHTAGPFSTACPCPMRRRTTLLAPLCAAVLWVGSTRPAMAIEEPAYDVLRQIGAVEIRQYAPYVVAEVEVEGTAESAGNTAFPILAGYIFGKNKGERKMAMTAPVTQTAAPMKMAMTAPVTQAATAAGRYTVQFVLPASVSLASAPEPLDARVKLREVPGARVAAIRYRGTWSQANYEEQLALLRKTLAKAQLVPEGEPVFSRYDPPLMPWFLRRNEIWLNLP